jgi:ADP-ribose pyrophosphatase
MTFEEKTISSEMLYEGRILNLRRDKVQVVNGGVSYREIVEHNGGVALIAVKDDLKVIMVKQFRKPIEHVTLEVPAGKIEKGEDPYTTAVRELKEETGYTAKNIELICKFYPSVGYSMESLYIYLCTDLTPGDTEFDEHEALDVLEYDLDELYNMAIEGELEDAKTIIAVIQAWTRVVKG